MKLFAPLLILVSLAACSGEPSGTYVAVLEDGQVPRNSDGKPRITLSLDDGQAIVRMGDETELLHYTVADEMLYLREPSKPRAEAFKIDGDRLLGNAMNFKKL